VAVLLIIAIFSLALSIRGEYGGTNKMQRESK